MEYDEAAKYYSYSDPDQDLWVFLTHTRYAIYRARERELQRYGISPEQVGILFIVQALNSRATPSEISRFIMRQPHTVSALIDRMERKGFVKKYHDLDKRNLVRVAITEKGVQAYDSSKKRGPIHRIMAVLSDEERIQLRELLRKLQVQARSELGMDADKLPPSDYTHD